MRVPYPVGMFLVFVGMLVVAQLIHIAVGDIALVLIVPWSLVCGWYATDVATWMAGDRV